jgi:hypothetical protein
MALIEFVRNYSDRSTDRGYQFEFHCDHCYSGFMSSFQPSLIGAAGGLLEVAGSLFGGILGSAGNSAYSIQRAPLAAPRMIVPYSRLSLKLNRNFAAVSYAANGSAPTFAGMSVLPNA